MSENPHLTLVLGGARSGKSAHAEGLIEKYPAPWSYIATARGFRLGDERADRGASRKARGAGGLRSRRRMELARAVSEAPADRAMLVDCLTLWLSNRLLARADLSAERVELVAALRGRAAPTVVVSSEVGLSIVPENALARAFRDAAGELHQAVARISGRVVLTVAGYPLTVKDATRR